MKSLLIFTILASMLSVSAFAEETSTECLSSRDENSRNSPKKELEQKKKEKSQTDSSTSTTGQ